MWKEGKPVYRNGKIIQYEDGKDVENPTYEEVEEPDTNAVLDYVRSVRRDRMMLFKDGKDVAGGYNFNAIKQISPNAGLSYGSYYDKLTGDWFLDARRQGVPRFQSGKDSAAYVRRIAPVVYKELVRRGVSNPRQKTMMLVRQFVHETGGGTSRNLRVNNNHSGYGYNPKTKTYARFKNDEDFVTADVSLLMKRYPEAFNSNNVVDFASNLRKNGYFTDTLQNYVNGLKNAAYADKIIDEHMISNPDLYDINAQSDLTSSIDNVTTLPYREQMDIPTEFAADRAGRWANVATPPPLIKITPRPKAR